MKFSYPIIEKPFKFEGFTCYPQYYSEHYAGGKYLYVYMFKNDEIIRDYIIYKRFFPEFEWKTIDLPIEWFESFKWIDGEVDIVWNLYYRYSSDTVTVEDAWDACYIDFPRREEKKAWFAT